MAGIAADNDVRGQLKDLLDIFLSEEWREVWIPLNLSVANSSLWAFRVTAKDIDVWKVCQKEQIMLVTGNRKSEGPDSLETAIRTLNQPDSLPVFTLADPYRMAKRRSYAKRSRNGSLTICKTGMAFRNWPNLFAMNGKP
jgi:hypothetical protein